MYYGKEFAEHQRIDTAHTSTTYFADPFASWQRGSNENSMVYCVNIS
jgi:IS30 family transposase